MDESDSSPICKNYLTVEQWVLKHVMPHENSWNNIDWSNIYKKWIMNRTADNVYERINLCEDKNISHLEIILIKFWVCGVLLNIVGVLGVLGHVISMIILSRPQMRSSFNYLLMSLSICDTIFIIGVMLIDGISSIYPYTGHLFRYYNNVYPFIQPIVYPIAYIAQAASIYIIMTLTVERYVAVCHPLKARSFCTYRRAKISFIVCVCFSLVYNMPKFWEFRTVTYQLPNTTIVIHHGHMTPIRFNSTYLKIYKHWLYLIVNYLIPFLTLAILNSLIYRQVRRANRERQNLSRSETRKIRLATMLLVAVVVFLVLNFPLLVLHISHAFHITIDFNVVLVADLLQIINHSVNFLIYISYGKKFRRIFVLIFFKRRVATPEIL